MKLARFLPLACLPLWFGASVAAAQDCLSLNNALALSQQQDPSIGAAGAQVVGAEARLTGVKSDWRPQISAFAQSNDGPTGLGDGRTNNQVGISVSQRLYDFGRGRLEQESAKARVAQADFRLDGVRNDVATMTAGTFLSVLRASERVEAARKRQAYLADLVGGLESRLKANAITAAEKNRIEAEFALAESDVIQEELALAAAQSDLRILTGSALQNCEMLAQFDGFIDARLPSTLLEIVDRAVATHPEILATQSEQTALQADLRVASRFRAPVVELQGVAAIANEDFDVKSETETRIGINVTAPLFGFGRHASRKQEAAANLQVARLSMDRLRRDIEQQITLVWKRAVAYEALAQSQAAARDSHRAEAHALLREFENGLRPYQDVLQAEAGVQNAILQEIEARYLEREQRLRLVSMINALSR
ncbi:MAG: TolC family protein [Hyphomonadaceae bacterium]|nr:TolC family protein [Hyphomonadaceae bacterium]